MKTGQTLNIEMAAPKFKVVLDGHYYEPDKDDVVEKLTREQREVVLNALETYSRELSSAVETALRAARKLS